MTSYSHLIFLCLFTLTWAHSNLRFPEPYNEDRYQPGNAFECKGSVRCGPCPLLPAKLHELPITTWRRGQRVQIQWHRNNHRDGFYRRSLVPFKHIMNPEAHKELAFDYGCHSQGTFKCPVKRDKWAERCGADNHNPPLLHSNKMVVPRIFPDGRYVFVQTWYGGSDRMGDPDRGAHAKFSNFYMCSLVDIKGGDAGPTTPVTFEHGIRDNFDPRGKEGTLGPRQCWSTSDRMLECGGNECKGAKLRAMTPATFKNEQGKPIQPEPVTRNDVMRFINSEPDYDMRSVYKEEVFPGWKDKKKKKQQQPKKNHAGDYNKKGQSSEYNTNKPSYGYDAPVSSKKSDVYARGNDVNKKKPRPPVSVATTTTPYPRTRDDMLEHIAGIIEPATLQDARAAAWRWTMNPKWELACGKSKMCFNYCERNEAECLSLDEL